jgi:CyaY protein
MSETEFLRIADRTLAAIGDALDRALADSDVDLDWSVNEGILEIECEDGSKVIVNRHEANREIWLAARGGGFHFRFDGRQWNDTRSGGELGAVLAEAIAAQSGLVVALAPLTVGP